MKINLIPTKKLAILSAAFCAAMLAFSPNAKALTFGDANDLGQVLFGIPSGDAARTHYVNRLISLAPGTTGFPADGQIYNRSLNNPGPGFPNYPNAVFALNGTGTTIDLGPTAGVYQYLFAKYDGPNAGSEVWYVGNLSGVITIPSHGLAGQNYGLSGWTLFTGSGGPPNVPDGGTTVMLLGAALGTLGMMRRFLKS
jgi:protein with PEP-CTERM/exosortase system signal